MAEADPSAEAAPAAEPGTVHRARLRHRIPGRTRIRLEAPLAAFDRLEQLADALTAIAGVHAVDIRPQTGSILIRHDRDCDPLATATERGLLELLPEQHAEALDPVQEVTRRLGQLDTVVTGASGGRLDIWGLAFAGLVAGGLVQLARGQVAGPATTLFGQAATLAMAKPLRMFAR